MAIDTKQGIRSMARKVLGIAGLLGAAVILPGCFVDSSGPACFPGQVQTSWVLTENNRPVECAPGDEVDLTVDGLTVDPAFACGVHTGISPEVTGGVNHSVSLKLFDSNNNLLSSTGVMSLFVPCGTIQNTPQVTFELVLP